MERKYDGYISSVNIAGKLYALRCEVVEVHPMICPKCGASIELKCGQGHCDYCNTYYTTQFQIIEQQV